MKVKVGNRIKIINMINEPMYSGKEGIVTSIDDAEQIHGTWGGCALVPDFDTFNIIETFVDRKLHLLDVMLEERCELYGVKNTIQYLLDRDFTPDELINELLFDEDDVKLALEDNE